MGLYKSIASGEPLFHSNDKFDTEVGWPVFTRLIEGAEISEIQDWNSDVQKRTQVISKSDGVHLGTAFAAFGDGLGRNGEMRYIIKGGCLKFVPLAELTSEERSMYGFGNPKKPEENGEATAAFEVITHTEGHGPVCPAGSQVVIHYHGTLMDGTVFDSSRDRGTPFECQIGVG